MTINSREELLDRLREEIRVAEDDIDDMEEMLTAMQMDIAFVKGRRCGACCLLQQLEEEDE